MLEYWSTAFAQAEDLYSVSARDSAIVLGNKMALARTAQDSARVSKMSNVPTLKLEKLVTIEEHYMSTAFLRASKDDQNPKLQAFGNIQDLDTLRLQDMDDAAVTVQVVSLAPGPSHFFSPDMCVESNNELKAGIMKWPNRLAGFAALPMGHIQEAVLELERAVLSLKFKGALINNHHNGQFYDDKRFWPIFEKAESLNVPIYLHPGPPSDDQMNLLYRSDSFSETTSATLGSAGWGWHEMTGLHVIRLVLAGVFDKFPNLQILIGHAGEGIPCMLERLERRMQPLMEYEGRKRTLHTVMQENISITIAGFFSIPVFKLLLALFPIERIMYSVDYPFVEHSQGTRFLQEIMKSDLLTQEEFDCFTHKNAVKLLKL